MQAVFGGITMNEAFLARDGLYQPAAGDIMPRHLSQRIYRPVNILYAQSPFTEHAMDMTSSTVAPLSFAQDMDNVFHPTDICLPRTVQENNVFHPSDICLQRTVQEKTSPVSREKTARLRVRECSSLSLCTIHLVSRQ